MFACPNKACPLLHTLIRVLHITSHYCRMTLSNTVTAGSLVAATTVVAPPPKMDY